MKKILGYEVLIDGKPATLGLPSVDSRGVLVPAKAPGQRVFIDRGESTTPRQAMRRANGLINRTLKVIKAVRGSVIYDWPLVKELCQCSNFSIKPVFRSKEVAK